MLEENMDHLSGQDRIDALLKQQATDSKEFKLIVAADKMSAELEITKQSVDQDITYEDVIIYLEANGITNGIVHGMIRLKVSQIKDSERFVVARGKAPGKGQDAMITYRYDKDRELLPKENEDGTVDFSNLNFVLNVQKGDVLAEKTFPVRGSDGVDIYGNLVDAKIGRDFSFPSGTNTVVSEDGTQLLAEMNGCLEMKNNRISVKDMFTISSDIDNSIGNIEMAGSVIINGDVREGFSVKAQGDIVVHGLVEGATIEAGGNINITHGMNGMNKGVIRADGNINCRYIENAEVYCKGDFASEFLINSNVEVGGSIILKGANARMLGGKYQAGNLIYTKDIGNDMFIGTEVIIDSEEMKRLTEEEPEVDEDLLVEFLDPIREYQKELAKIDSLIESIKTNENMPNSDDIMQAALIKKRKINKAIQIVKHKMEDFIRSQNTIDMSYFRIVATGTVYPGTRLRIAREIMKIDTEYKYMKFVIKDRFLTADVITPADKIY